MRFWPKASGACCCEATPQGCGSITGTVRQCCSSTGPPLPGATVVLKQSGATVYTTTTAADGTFAIPIYTNALGSTLVFSHPDFTTQTSASFDAFCGSNTDKSTHLDADNVDWTCGCVGCISASCPGTALNPYTLHLTAGPDTVTLYNLAESRSIWRGCVTRAVAGKGGTTDSCGDAATVTAVLWYELACTVVGNFSLQALYWHCFDGARTWVVAGGSCANFGGTRNRGFEAAVPASCGATFSLSFAAVTNTSPSADFDLWGGSMSAEVSA